ncbi:MAG: hypothetical protein V4495_29160 [Pseudomonadota bacterium]
MANLDNSETNPTLSSRFAFVLNQIEVDAKNLPFELAPGCYLSLASEEQIAWFRQNILRLTGERNFSHSFYFEKGKRKIIGSTDLEIIDLPKSEWRYYSINVPIDFFRLEDIQMASKACNVPLEICGLSHEPNGGTSTKEWVLGNIFSPLNEFHPKNVSIQELKLIAENYTLLVNSNTYPFVREAFVMFDQLNTLPKISRLNVVGLFAVIEMLVTHKQQNNNRNDSISRQIKDRMTELSKIIGLNLTLPAQLKLLKPSKRWDALYDYRSAVAHGDDRKISVNADDTNEYLKAVIQSILRDALRNPKRYEEFRTKLSGTIAGKSTGGRRTYPRKNKPFN